MDSLVRVPGTSIQVGLDPLLGLVPGLGDAAGAAVAGYLIVLAARLDAPSEIIVRMLSNVALDTAAGSVPVAGDVFDIGWRSNSRNLALLERFLEQPAKTVRASRAVIAAAIASLALLAAGGVALAWFLVRLVVGLFA